MLTKYRSCMDRMHDYLCNDPDHPIVQIHHSYIDHAKLFKARVICWIYISAIYLWAIWEMASITTNFIYLTMQGYFMTWLFYTLVLQDYWLTKVYGKENHPCKKLKHYIELVYETAFCFELPITFVFWAFLFQILLRNHASTKDLIMNTNLHLGPLVCLIVELYYNNFSFPKRHFWVLCFYGTGYLMINLVYSLAVKVIYEPINWISALSYALVIGSYVFAFGAHYFGGYSYRRWKAPKLTTRITEGLIEQIEPKTSNSKTTEDFSNKNLYANPLGAKKDYEIAQRINEGRKKDAPTKDQEILL